jgi:hypothetical protein
MTAWRLMVAPVSKLAGRSPQPRVRPARSFPVKKNICRYSLQERPQEMTPWSLKATRLVS